MTYIASCYKLSLYHPCNEGHWTVRSGLLSNHAEYYSCFTKKYQCHHQSFASASGTVSVEASPSFNDNGPSGNHWKAIQQWIVFSDLHVSSKTAKVSIDMTYVVKDLMAL